jgi:release factor glutamine methyltransferase
MSRQVPSYLREGGWLLVEIGQGQGAKISALLEQSGCFRGPELIRDLSGIERVIKVQKAEG